MQRGGFLIASTSIRRRYSLTGPVGVDLFISAPLILPPPFRVVVVDVALKPSSRLEKPSSHLRLTYSASVFFSHLFARLG